MAVVLARDASVVVAGGAYVVVAAARAFGCTNYIWWRFSAQWGCWSIGSFHSWSVSGRSFSDNGYTLHGVEGMDIFFNLFMPSHLFFSS